MILISDEFLTFNSHQVNNSNTLNIYTLRAPPSGLTNNTKLVTNLREFPCIRYRVCVLKFQSLCIKYFYTASCRATVWSPVPDFPQ